MKERPTLMNAEMVRATLEDRKTQTRRALKRQFLDVLPLTDKSGWIGLVERETAETKSSGEVFRCKFGVPGDRLWVRETWQSEGVHGHERDFPVRYRASGDDRVVGGRWRPSTFMPRWASRISLRITDVRCERLRAISKEDAIAEGIEPVGDYWKSYEIIHEGPHKGTSHPHSVVPNRSPIVSYRELWESINGKGSWLENPFVWAISFERVK